MKLLSKGMVSVVLSVMVSLCADPAWTGPEYNNLIYQDTDLNAETYALSRHDIETEHQIGRLINFKNVISQCKFLEGDFIEFGTWSGFSLMWMAHLAEKQELYSKQIIGLDGFVGLPYSEDGFVAGGFKATLEQCVMNINHNARYYPNNHKNMVVGEYLFSKKNEIISFLNGLNLKKFCFIHIDCDISTSAIEIFDVLVDGEYIADTAFIAFDDYYLNLTYENSYENTVQKLLKGLFEEWDVVPYLRTDLTQIFKVSKKI